MTKKVSGALLAKVMLPDQKDLKQCLVYAELSMKMQIMLFDLSSSLWWSSVAEVLIWFPFAFFFFCLDAGRMGGIWLFLPHLVRAGLGLLIIKKLPTSQELISKISMQRNDSIPFNKITHWVITSTKDALAEFTTRAGKFMLIYSILTAVALVLDFIVFFIGVASMNSDYGAFSTVFLVILSVTYFIIAFYFVGWAIAIRQRLPPYAQS